MDDLEHVARLDGDVCVLRPGNDLAVSLDRDGTVRQTQVLDQPGQGERGRDVALFAVDGDAHAEKMARAPRAVNPRDPSAVAAVTAHSESGIGIQNVRNFVMLPRRS